eukprot:TRINITY_DN9353_c1_g1_i2.p1 TRINITY_DN9353_c1_g1~~TRINITY_DN9353_c1_g1_i2.p1  ORF type:complete len:423 (-),score=68.41 TRINITY_DN9353_c1_g1_i2:245-1513(-)
MAHQLEQHQQQRDFEETSQQQQQQQNQQQQNQQQQNQQQQNQQQQNQRQFTQKELQIDIELARRFAKLPVNALSADVQVEVMKHLIPGSLHRWTCNRSASIEEEQLFRQHPAVHSNLDGQEYYNRLKSTLQHLKWQRFENKTFLEIGFGVALTAAWLRGLRAEVYATEIQPIPWVPSRHGPFFDDMYTFVKEGAATGVFGPRFDLNLARNYSLHCGKNVSGVHELSTTLEKLDGVPVDGVDISFSLAVLEHISDVQTSFASLARVHRKSSLTCHQVDMRDHRNWARPWDFFLLTDKEFRDMTLGNSFYGHPYFGNRLRLSEFMGAAALNGFEIVYLERQHESATEEGLKYAKDVLKKLKQLDRKKYRYAKWKNLGDFSKCTANGMPETGVFVCFRLVGPGPIVNSEVPTCGQDVWFKSGFSF